MALYVFYFFFGMPLYDTDIALLVADKCNRATVDGTVLVTRSRRLADRVRILTGGGVCVRGEKCEVFIRRELEEGPPLNDEDVAQLVTALCLQRDDGALLLCTEDLELVCGVIGLLRVNGCVAEICDLVRSGPERVIHVKMVAKGVLRNYAAEEAAQE